MIGSNNYISAFNSQKLIEVLPILRGNNKTVSYARSKYKTGSLIVLDEPNAAVDAEYEIEM